MYFFLCLYVLMINIGKDDKAFSFITINHFPSSSQTSDHDTKNPNNAILFHLETFAKKGSHPLWVENYGVFKRCWA